MRSSHAIHAANHRHLKIAPEFDYLETGELWRTLARLITLFDRSSPAYFSSGRNRRIL
jgi:hypothetical protein